MRYILSGTFGRVTSCLLLCIMFLNTVFILKPQAAYAPILTDGKARVLEVLDGDAIKVRFIPTDEVALVRLLGVSAEGNDAAYSYLNKLLLGKTVDLRIDDGPVLEDRWNYLNVYMGNIFVNEEIIKRGLAKSTNGKLVQAEATGRGNKLGVWADTGMKPNTDIHATVSEGININTAPMNILMERLKGMNTVTAMNIITYRQFNPFNRPTDIKFVPGFTKQMFDDNKDLLHMRTQINNAPVSELLSLLSVTPPIAQAIIAQRKQAPFSDLNELVQKRLMPEPAYKQNLNYMTVSGSSLVLGGEGNGLSIPAFRADINTSKKQELVDASLTEKQADALISARTYYGFKHLGEIGALLNLNAINLNALADNLYTTYDANATYINVNSASHSDLSELGLTEKQIQEFMAGRTKTYGALMKSGKDFPIDLSSVKDKISLFTNINKASVRELMSLSPRMTADIANGIVHYREIQPFGSYEEFSAHLNAEGTVGLYNEIVRYITIR